MKIFESIGIVVIRNIVHSIAINTKLFTLISFGFFHFLPLN